MSSSSKVTSRVILKCSTPQINNVKNRIAILSPTVEIGLERECTSDDFLRDDSSALGKGAFGEVWKVTHRDTSKSYCIKVLNKDDIIEEKLQKQTNLEISIMYDINHKNSVSLVNHFEDNKRIYLVMDYANNGSLFSYLQKNGRITERSAAKFFIQIVGVVKYLHTKGIIHRDIKLENLLLNTENNSNKVLLCDYGWACYIKKGEKCRKYCGTPEYASPEMVQKKAYNYSVDIWSMGVILYEMICGFAPFKGSTREELYKNILNVNLKFPEDISANAKALICSILRKNPSERISLDDMLNSEWVKENISNGRVPSDTFKLRKSESLVSKKEILISHLITIDNKNVDIDFTQTSIAPKKDSSTVDVNLTLMKIENLRLDFECVKLKRKMIDYEKIMNEKNELSTENTKIKKDIELYKDLLEERTELVSKVEKLTEEKSSLKEEVSKLTQKVTELNSRFFLQQDFIRSLTEIKEDRSERAEGIPDCAEVSMMMSISSKCNEFLANQTVLKSKSKEIIEKLSSVPDQIGVVLSAFGSSIDGEIAKMDSLGSLRSSKGFMTVDFLKKKMFMLQDNKFKLEKLEIKVNFLHSQLKSEKEKNSILSAKIASQMKLLNQKNLEIVTKKKLIFEYKSMVEDLKAFLGRNKKCIDRELYEKILKLLEV